MRWPPLIVPLFINNVIFWEDPPSPPVTKSHLFEIPPLGGFLMTSLKYSPQHPHSFGKSDSNAKCGVAFIWLKSFRIFRVILLPTNNRIHLAKAIPYFSACYFCQPIIALFGKSDSNAKCRVALIWLKRFRIFRVILLPTNNRIHLAKAIPYFSACYFCQPIIALFGKSDSNAKCGVAFIWLPRGCT